MPTDRGYDTGNTDILHNTEVREAFPKCVTTGLKEIGDIFGKDSGVPLRITKSSTNKQPGRVVIIGKPEATKYLNEEPFFYYEGQRSFDPVVDYTKDQLHFLFDPDSISQLGQVPWRQVDDKPGCTKFLGTDSHGNKWEGQFGTDKLGIFSLKLRGVIVNSEFLVVFTRAPIHDKQSYTCELTFRDNRGMINPERKIEHKTLMYTSKSI